MYQNEVFSANIFRRHTQLRRIKAVKATDFLLMDDLDFHKEVTYYANDIKILYRTVFTLCFWQRNVNIPQSIELRYSIFIFHQPLICLRFH